MAPETGGNDEQKTPPKPFTGTQGPSSIGSPARQKTLAKIVPKHDLHPTQINEWRKQLLDRAADILVLTPRLRNRALTSKSCTPRLVNSPWRKIFCKALLQQCGIAERKKMINTSDDLPVIQQAKLLKISRGTVYYKTQSATEVDLKLMRRMDELHLDYPFAGSRMLRDFVRRESFVVGRHHVRTLMLRMGMQAIYRKPNTSRRNQAHKVYLYLLRDLQIIKAV